MELFRYVFLIARKDEDRSIRKRREWKGLEESSTRREF